MVGAILTTLIIPQEWLTGEIYTRNRKKRYFFNEKYVNVRWMGTRRH